MHNSILRAVELSNELSQCRTLNWFWVLFLLHFHYISFWIWTMFLSFSPSLSHSISRFSLINLVCCFALQFDAFRYVQLMSNLIACLQIFFKLSEFYAYTK